MGLGVGRPKIYNAPRDLCRPVVHPELVILGGEKIQPRGVAGIRFDFAVENVDIGEISVAPRRGIDSESCSIRISLRTSRPPPARIDASTVS